MAIKTMQLKWLLLGLLVVSAPFLVRASDEYEEAEEAEEGGDGGDEEKDVVVLTVSNFEEKLKSAKYALVEFYAPWCGHCKTLKPHYAKAATLLKASNPDVLLGKVDATVESDLGTKFGVQGYPTMKWFIDGEMASDYNGGRDADGLVKWVKKKAGPAAIALDTKEAADKAEKEHPLMVVGFFSAKDSEAAKAFASVASKMEDAVFGEVTADVAKAYGVADGSAALVKNFEGEERAVVVLDKELTAESLTELILGEKLPLSIEFSQANSDKIFNSGIKKQVLLWGKAADVSGDSETLKMLRAVSKEFKGKLVFVTVDSEGESAEPVTNFFGLKDATAPAVVGFWMEKNKKYNMKDDLTLDNLKAFAAAVVDGTATADYKSAPVPEGEAAGDGGVAIIVGKSVDSIVMNLKKDVLLEVYAPWCGHCKKLDPIYKKLAKRFKTVESVVIAKMDGTENEHPDIEVKGFPTILFYPAGDVKKAIVFEGGDRSLKALTKFIKQHATVAYELPKKGKDSEETSEATKSGDDKDEL